MSAEISLPGLQMAAFSRCPHITFFLCAGKESTLSGVSSFTNKDTNPMRLGPNSMSSLNLNYLDKTLFPNTVTLEVRASIYEFGGGQNVVLNFPSSGSQTSCPSHC